MVSTTAATEHNQIWRVNFSTDAVLFKVAGSDDTEEKKFPVLLFLYKILKIISIYSQEP